MLEDMIPSLERVEWTMQTDGLEFQTHLSSIEAYLCTMVTNSSVDVSSLNLCPPSVPLFTAQNPTPAASTSRVSMPLSTNPPMSTLSIQETPAAESSAGGLATAQAHGKPLGLLYMYLTYH